MEPTDDFTKHQQAAHGLVILHRLVPAPDHGRGFRRDPETGFVYYSSEWLSDDNDRADRNARLNAMQSGCYKAGE